MPFTFNPLSGTLDYYTTAETAASILAKLLTVDGAGSGLVADGIPVVSTDPVLPFQGQAWLLVANAGTPIGLLLSLTREMATTSQLSIYNGTSIVRTTMT